MKPKTVSYPKKLPAKQTSYYRRNTKRCNQEARIKRCKTEINENGGRKAC